MRPTYPITAALTMVVTFCLAACGGEGGGEPGDAAPGDDAGPTPDAAAREPAALLADFCRRRAEALCDKAFECLAANPAAVGGVLGLPGADPAGCAEGVRQACEDDLGDRLRRDAVRLPEDPSRLAANIDGCVGQIESTPCVDRDPATWVMDWNRRMHTVCAHVAPGAAETGEACQRRADCAVDGQICAAGSCRLPTADDLMVECEATGPLPGQLDIDPACPGQVCVQVGENVEAKTGLCTIDCRTGIGCPNGGLCIQSTVGGRAPTFYCTHLCSRDSHCANGFSCVHIQGESSERHCWVNEPG